METIEDLFSPEDPEDEKDPEDEDGVKTALPTKKMKASKDLWELFNKIDSDKKAEKEVHIDVDKTPELDAEAPVEHLSRAEEIAVSQTMAEERLVEIEQSEEELSNEHIAAVNYLEAVAATGYVEEEFNSVVSEYGTDAETLISSVQDEPEQIDQTAEILNQPLASESEVSIAHEPPLPSVEIPESTKTEEEKEKETKSIVSYLISRRKGRLKNKESSPVVEKELNNEVSDIRTKLESRENQIRRIAKLTESLPENPRLSKRKNRPEKLPDKLMPKEVLDPVQAEIKAQTINRDELLSIASDIEVEGNKLNVIYFNNLLGEHGLRRVVAEYLKGGNVKKVLQKEMVEREMDFERDPAIRDRGEGNSVDSKSASIEDLVQKSGIDWNDDSPEVLPTKSKQKIKQNVSQEISKVKNVKALDFTLIFVIIALLITLIIVLIRK